MNDLFDICSRKHGGNIHSRAANERAAPCKATQRAAVFMEVVASDDAGLTCRELASRWGVDMNQISGRFSELKAGGLIAQSGRRGKCGVWYAKK
jgi:hypothetical protein